MMKVQPKEVQKTSASERILTLDVDVDRPLPDQARPDFSPLSMNVDRVDIEYFAHPVSLNPGLGTPLTEGDSTLSDLVATNKRQGPIPA
jgi:hypothetical protein